MLDPLLRPFIDAVDGGKMPAAILTKFSPIEEQLATLDFHSPVYHLVGHKPSATHFLFEWFLHSSGQACARIYGRVWAGAQPPKEKRVGRGARRRARRAVQRTPGTGRQPLGSRTRRRASTAN